MVNVIVAFLWQHGGCYGVLIFDLNVCHGKQWPYQQLILHDIGYLMSHQRSRFQQSLVVGINENFDMFNVDVLFEKLLLAA